MTYEHGPSRQLSRLYFQLCALNMILLKQIFQEFNNACFFFLKKNTFSILFELSNT